MAILVFNELRLSKCRKDITKALHHLCLYKLPMCETMHDKVVKTWYFLDTQEIIKQERLKISKKRLENVWNIFDVLFQFNTLYSLAVVD